MADTKAAYNFSQVFWEKPAGSGYLFTHKNHNHGWDGVNILYVGGHAKWVSTLPRSGSDSHLYREIPQEAVPNNTRSTTSMTNRDGRLRTLNDGY
ncbi:hypothetical protein M0P98_01965 [bacterium]|nr:hypothetical protein [bacterium]